MLYSASDKAKLFAKNFSKNSNLDDSGIPSRTNLELHNICVTPKMVSTVIINFDLLKESGPDCIPVVVLQSCKPKLSYILHISRTLQYVCEGLFPNCWKVSSLVTVFKIIGE